MAVRRGVVFERWVVGLILVIYMAPLLIASTTYPGYYEDEGWVYLPVFELLRGNGVSYGALDQGQIPNPAFALISSVLIAFLPFGPVLSVRVLSCVYGLCYLGGVYVLTKRLAPKGAIYAAAIFISVPLVFLTSRYGRVDFLAAALGLWALASAHAKRPLIAGTLAAMSICTHPVMLWIALPAAAWIWRMDRPYRALLLFVLPLAVCGLMQLVWITFNWDATHAIVKKYFVTASIGEADSASRLAASLAAEPARYVAYWTALTLADKYVHVLLLFAALAGCVFAASETLWPMVLAVICAVTSIAALVGSKNPYYLVHVVPILTVVSGIAVARAPRGVVLALIVLSVAWVAFRHVPAAFAAAMHHSTAMVQVQIEQRLPQGAVVVSPMLYAGLIRSRPDLRFYSYHALSDREGWRLPTCQDIPRRIRRVVASDARPSSIRLPPPREVYFLAHPMGQLGYLRLIYLDTDPQIVACLAEGEKLDVPAEASCQRFTPGKCFATGITRRAIPW